MAKEDFCFTYYDGDAARDMAHMTRLERGAYTDIIISQRKFGRLTLDQIRKILGRDFTEVWPAISLVMKEYDTAPLFAGSSQPKLYAIEWVESSIERSKKHAHRQTENIKKRFKNPKVVIPDENLVLPKDNLVLPKQNLVIPLEDGNGNEYVDEDKEGGTGETKPRPRAKPRPLPPPTIDDYQRYTTQVIEGNDPVFESILHTERLTAVNGRLKELAGDHLSLISRYGWKPPDQQQFRLSLVKHIRDQLAKKKPANQPEPVKDWGKL